MLLYLYKCNHVCEIGNSLLYLLSCNYYLTLNFCKMVAFTISKCLNCLNHPLGILYDPSQINLLFVHTKYIKMGTN